MDWLALLAVQGTLKSLLQHHSSKASCGGSGLIAKLDPTLATPQTGPPASSVHGILQARTLELVAISLSGGSAQPGDRTLGSSVAGRFFMAEPPGKP